MRTRKLARGRLLVVFVVLSSGACTHYWERPGAGVADFERESAVCIEEAKKIPYGAGIEQIYRSCMRAKGWKRVEVSVAENNQFRGPEDVEDFARPPAPLSGTRYQNR